MSILAEIPGIKYKPLLCRELKTFNIVDLEKTLADNSVFILKVNKETVAISRWVSAKRTRSYPYAHVYDSLSFCGKKVTVIPIYKDEGKEGDRDFLQWDSVSLMSLMGVYTIIAYYVSAERSKRYRYKITKQKFDMEYIKDNIKELLIYRSDPLHWNIEQLDKIGKISQKALDSYLKISKRLDVEMHSTEAAEKRIKDLLKGGEEFRRLSRRLAEEAQNRESLTMQPKEKIVGTKAKLTIKNYIGGYYYFTSDEVVIDESDIYLIECKHSGKGSLPSIADIKDGLLKMILFTNLRNVKVGGREYNPIPVLKLTVEGGFNKENISKNQRAILDLLRKEAEINKFKLSIV